MNTPTGSTLTLKNSNSVQLDLHGRLDLLTGGSTFTNLVLTSVQHFRSLAHQVPQYGSLTFAQVHSVQCPAYYHHWSPRKILLLPTPPSRWKFHSLGCIYRFLSTRAENLSVEACQITLLTSLSRVERCSA